MAVLGIDFDHTLVEGDQPLEGAKEAVNIIREAGHKVVIYSCNNYQWIEKVLNNHDIRYDSIWNTKTGQGKLLADCYVDDKAYRFLGSWANETPLILDYVKGLDNRKW